MLSNCYLNKLHVCNLIWLNRSISKGLRKIREKMINSNYNKPVTYTVSKIFNGYKVTFFNASKMPTDAVELVRRTKGYATDYGQRMLELNK